MNIPNLIPVRPWRAADASIETAIEQTPFAPTASTTNLTDGGKLESAERMPCYLISYGLR